MLASQVETLTQLLRRRIQVSGDHPSYSVKRHGEWIPVTWSQFGDRVDHLAAALVDGGFANGDTAAILGGCNPGWVLSDLATMVAGGTVVGVYETLQVDQVQFILEDAGASVLFVEGADQLARVLPLLKTVDSLVQIIAWGCEAEHTHGTQEAHGKSLLANNPHLLAAREASVMPDDIAIVVYTSGTTGHPKGVPLPHGMIVRWLRSTGGLMSDRIQPDDCTLSFLPMAHVAEHVPGLFGRMNIGLQTHYATGYDTLLDELTEVRPTYFGAVPRIFEKMHGRIRERVASSNPRRQAIFRWAEGLAHLKSQSRNGGRVLTLWERAQFRLADRLVFNKLRAVFGGRVKYFITGSAPIDIQILEFFDGVGMVILEVYGLSESCAIAFANTVEDHRIGTVGKVVPGVEYKLASDGEILLRGETIFTGYRGLPEANAEAFDDEGYFRTGDIGEVDSDGFLRITDRKKNLIKTAGGKYVVPARLEALLKEEPSISQVYVHGDRRPFVVALITVDDRELPRLAAELSCTESEVSSHPEIHRRVAEQVARANQRLAPFEQIKRFEILPEDFSIAAGTVTPTLKIKRKAVVGQYADLIDSMYEAASRAHRKGA